MQVVTERRFREKNMAAHTSYRSLCPFILTPFDECYCASTSSLHTEATIRFCGGNFEDCEIYQKHMKGGIQ